MGYVLKTRQAPLLSSRFNRFSIVSNVIDFVLCKKSQSALTYHTSRSKLHLISPLKRTIPHKILDTTHLTKIFAKHYRSFK